MTIVAVDWGRNNHAYVVVGGSERQPLLQGEFPNRTDAFESWARDIEEAAPHTDIVVALESGGGLAFPLEQFCQARGWRLHHVTAAAVKSYRENVMGKTRKTDQLDCLAIAALAFGCSHSTKGLERKALRRATRDREALALDKTRLSNRLRQLVAELCPELTVEQFPDIAAAGLLHLLSFHPDPQLWAQLGEDGVKKLLKQSGVRSRSELISKLVRVATGFRPVVFGANRAVLLREIEMVARRLSHCIGDIAMADEFIAQLSEGDAAVQAIRALPGAGEVLAPAIVAEVQNVANFPSEAHLASYAGIGLKQHQTGKSSNYWTPQLRSNRRLKRLITQFALGNSKSCPKSRAYYEAKLKSKKPLQARRALARQLVRVIFRTLRAVPEGPPERY